MDAQAAHELLEEILAEHEHPSEGLELIDWNDEHDPTGDVVEGFALPGRWTATVAGAKVGKSILLIAMSVEVSEGRDPWTGEEREPLDVVYIDTEMGRVDIEERLDDCGYDPPRLKRWHACEIPPRLDTPEGGAKVMATVTETGARLVVIDGLNGTVSGSEKDDTPWRDLYEFTIRRLKAASIAVVSADNHGKDETLGPRGSSVKLDKADAVIRISRIEGGVTLTATHRRTAAYADQVNLDVFGLDGGVPVRYRTRGGRAWPAGTKDAAALLDELDIDRDLGRPTIRRMLRDLAEGAVDAERYRVGNQILSAAIAWRKQLITPFSAGTGIAKLLVDGRDSSESDSAGTDDGDSQSKTPLPGGTAAVDSLGQGCKVSGAGGEGVRKYTPPATTAERLDSPPDPARFG